MTAAVQISIFLSCHETTGCEEDGGGVVLLNASVFHAQILEVASSAGLSQHMGLCYKWTAHTSPPVECDGDRCRLLTHCLC